MSAENRQLDLEERLRRLNEIGVALSGQDDLHNLLDRILLEARRFTNADAGTLYLAKDDHLTFEVTQNDSLESFSGTVDVPPVPLNTDSVSGYAAVTGEILNINDVYSEGRFCFEGPRNYDKITGYHTKSMLVVPMNDHEDEIIGVLQLLNATLPSTSEIVPFTKEDEPLLESLASQAAVSVNNVRLIGETEALFDSFVQVMATAIDERSPYTGGHIRRVAELAMSVAEAVNSCDEGPLKDAVFTDNELNALRIASWMHDIGKITTPEWIVDKPTKLTTIYDRIDLLRTRFELLERTIESDMLSLKVAHLEAGDPVPDDLQATHEKRLAELRDDLAFIERVNRPGEFMEEADLERLESIRCRQYLSSTDGNQIVPLTDDEFENLSICKGSLTDDEVSKIRDHAAMSIKMLEQIPFTRKLRRVPAIAGAHHERLNGTGYPRGLSAEDINLQSRILALVDIFESLSADDRPYRDKPMPRDLVLKILREEVESNHLDGNVLELFLAQKLFLKLDEIKARMARQQAESDSHGCSPGIVRVPNGPVAALPSRALV